MPQDIFALLLCTAFIIIWVILIVGFIYNNHKKDKFKKKFPKLFDDDNWQIKNDCIFVFKPTNETTVITSLGACFPSSLNCILSSFQQNILEDYLEDLIEKRYKQEEYNYK